MKEDKGFVNHIYQKFIGSLLEVYWNIVRMI